jgi:hypothetical protein
MIMDIVIFKLILDELVKSDEFVKNPQPTK